MAFVLLVMSRICNCKGKIIILNIQIKDIHPPPLTFFNFWVFLFFRYFACQFKLILENIHCIALRTVRHSDSTSIVTAWSRERGRIAIAVNAGASREARRRRALMMPLGMFEGIGHFKPGEDICRMSDVRLTPGAAPVQSAVGSVVAMFLADFLATVLRDTPPDPAMSDFLFSEIGSMSSLPEAALANFHLMIIYRMGHFLGIEPDLSDYAPGRWFDMREARFTAAPPLHRQALDPDRARIVALLSRLRRRNLARVRLSRADRNTLLDHMLDYYALHHTSLSTLASLPIVREIFT